MSKKSKSRKEQKKEKKFFLGGDYGKFWKFFPIILFFVLTIILFGKFVFSDQMLFGTDTLEAGVMFRSFYVNFVKQFHQIPMWNPYLYGGIPFVDGMHGDTFCPLAALQIILPFYRSLGWKLFFTVFLAGIFMYYCLRAFKFSYGVSLFGALGYMFSTNFVSWAYGGQDGKMYLTSLLPLLFWFVEKGLETKKFLYFLLLGLAVGLMLLANHPQLFYYSMWSLGLYFLFKIVFLYKDEKKFRSILKPALFFILALILGLTLGLIQIYPPYVYVNKFSPRAQGARGYDYATSWSSHPEELAGLVNPEFPGLNMQEEPTYWGRNPFKHNLDYGGISVLLLAFLTFFVVKDRRIWFFLGLSLLALIYSLGAHTPIYKLFYYLVPQVKNFRAPSLILFLFFFSTIFLAGFFLEKIFKELKSEETKKILKVTAIILALFFLITLLFSVAGGGMMSIWKSIFYTKIDPAKDLALSRNLPSVVKGFWLSFLFLGIAGAGVYLFLKGKLSYKLLIIVLSLFLVVDLLRVDRKFIETLDPANEFTEDAAVRFLKNDFEYFRVLSLPNAYRGANSLAGFGLKQTLGYHGNQLKRYDEFTQEDYWENAPPDIYVVNFGIFLFGKKFDLTSTKYVVARQGFTPDRLAQVFQELTTKKYQIQLPALNLAKFKPVFQGEGLMVYQNLDYLPWARVVFDYEVNSNSEAILNRLVQPDFDDSNKIILEENPEISSAQFDSVKGQGEVKIKSNNINNMEFEVSLNKPGFLVLAENHYPSWKAFVAGKETKIYRANYTFQAIPLEKGNHLVKLSFVSKTYKIGKTSSLLTLLLMGIIFLSYGVKPVFFKRKKQ